MFNVWKSKLKKHEDRQQGEASQHYRHYKRALAKQNMKEMKEHKDLRERELENLSKNTPVHGQNAFINAQMTKTQYQNKSGIAGITPGADRLNQHSRLSKTAEDDGFASRESRDSHALPTKVKLAQSTTPGGMILHPPQHQGFKTF